MGTPDRSPAFSSVEKTKQSYTMSNISLSFPISTSNAVHALSPDFPPLKPSRSFIQATKSNSIMVQHPTSPSTDSTLPTLPPLNSQYNSQYFKTPNTLEIILLEPEYNFEKWLNFFGITDKILPPSIRDKFEFYKNHSVLEKIA